MPLTHTCRNKQRVHDPHDATTQTDDPMTDQMTDRLAEPWITRHIGQGGRERTLVTDARPWIVTGSQPRQSEKFKEEEDNK